MNGRIESRLQVLGLTLPPPLQLPADAVLPFAMVRVLGNRALISGHGPQGPDGVISGPFGRLGHELDVAQGYQAARLAALSMLGSLQRALGTLDRVQRWTRIFGMVCSTPEFVQQPAVINGFSDLILELFGDERGQHARSAVGMAVLPYGIPVEIEGEVEIEPGVDPYYSFESEKLT